MMDSMRRTRTWRILVVVTAVLIGLLFTTTALTSRGTSLRAAPQTQLLGLIEALQRSTDQQADTLADLTAQAGAALDRIGEINAEAGAAAAGAEQGAASAGLTGLTGSGVRIVLDDAPREPGGGLPPGARPDDVVIHQSDIQAVVNALWAAGVDGVAIMGQRIVATSAILCVGNTLRLQGQTYSPPYVVTAIGDEALVRTELARSPGVELLLDAVEQFGLGWSVQNEPVELSAYDESLTLRYATGA